MIKVIAFDFAGVLVKEKEIKLSSVEDRLERLFGDNISNEDYLNKAKKIFPMEENIEKITKNIILKLYKVLDKDIFKKIKQKYADIKIAIASNHLTYIRNFINEKMDKNNIDRLFISADLKMIKPNKEFFEEILHQYNIGPEELLFIDNKLENIEQAKKMNINTIHVNSTDNLCEQVLMWLKENM